MHDLGSRLSRGSYFLVSTAARNRSSDSTSAGIGHGIRDFLAKEFAIPLAKPVNRHLERSLRRVHFASQRGIRRVGLPEKEHLQPFEMLRAAVMHELVAQSLHDSVEHRKRPAPFEDPLRRLIVRRLALVAVFAGGEFKRQNCPAATFVRALAVLFVGHKEFQRSQKKGPEPALSPGRRDRDIALPARA